VADGMTIAELADLVGMSARNIRAHQSRGLLHAPRLEGRVAYYGGAHAARLELVKSLQREGFTLSAIQRLVEEPDSYVSIVADRRRRLRAEISDIAAGVPVSEDEVRRAGADLPERLLDLGLCWRSGDLFCTHTVLAGVSRTLLERGIPVETQSSLTVQAGQAGADLAADLRVRLLEHVPEDGGTARAQERSDLGRVAVQLFAAAFEIALSQALARSVQPPADRSD
jgi:DNA-binding transcriptional MerR regulator